MPECKREASPPRADVQQGAPESSKEANVPHEAIQMPINWLFLREPQPPEHSDRIQHREREYLDLRLDLLESFEGCYAVMGTHVPPVPSTEH